MTAKKKKKKPGKPSSKAVSGAASAATEAASDTWSPEPLPPTDEIWTRDLADPGTDLRIAVLGTSVSWGQGLWPKDKACVRCARILMKNGGFTKAAVASYAQSGATLWAASQTQPLEKSPYAQVSTSLATLSPPSSAARNLTHLDGETPSPTPYIWDQAARASVDFRNAGRKPSFVWLDAGANDLGFLDTVLAKDQAACAQYVTSCLNNMTASFTALLTAIWKDPHLGERPIVVTGYYLAASEAGFDHGMSAPGMLDFIVDWASGDTSVPSIKQRVIHNMAAFRNLVQVAWKAVVATLVANGRDVTYVEPAFANDGRNVMFVPGTSALWPRTRPPFDSLHGHRLVESTDRSVWAHLEAKVLTAIAGFAHPNPRGAQLYAEAVAAAVAGKDLRV